MIYNLWALSMLPRLGMVRRMRGFYRTWEEAQHRCTGYDTPEIVAKCLDAARRVRAGQALWERDSVPMPAVQYSWPVLAELLLIRSLRGRLRVLDFGGGLGSSYLQFKSFAGTVSGLKWTIVEQENLAQVGAREFATSELVFHSDLSQLDKEPPDVVLLSSVLQYLPEPRHVLAKLQSGGPASIILDRTPISNRGFFSVQHVPASIYRAAYPIQIFSEAEIVSMFSNWTLVSDFPSYCDFPKKLFRGRIFRPLT